MKARSQSSSILTKRSRSQASRTGLDASFRLRQKKSRRDFSHGAIPFENYQSKSGFGLFRVRCLLTLRFQLGELRGRKNSFGLFEKRIPTFLSAACLHAFGLP